MSELMIKELALMILPVILGGIFNMAWVKSPLFNNLRRPMDMGKSDKHGIRYFGDNKTWKGFLGMIVLTAAFASLIHWLLLVSEDSISSPYTEFSSPVTSSIFGALMGLAYVLGELPNSYIKRRLNIQPGQNGSGTTGRLFILIDQVDSVIACGLVIPFFYPLSLQQFIFLVIACGALHILINMALYSVKLKSQIF